MPTAGFVAAVQRLVGEIFRFNGQLLDVAADLSGHLQVTPTHWQTMAVIRNEPMTVSAISRHVGLRRQSVRHTVRQLEARGFVRLDANPRHLRAPLVRLTPAGRRLMQQLLELQVMLTTRFRGDLRLTEGEVDRIVGVLRDLRQQAEADSSRGS